jgi:hypothetical protein
MRSALFSQARRRASRDGWGRSRASGAGFPKPPGDFLESRQERRFLDLDLADPGFQRDAANALGLAGFGLLELVLEASDFLSDLPRGLFHSG